MTTVRSPVHAGIVVAGMLLSACAAAPNKDDPFEPWNRAMYQVHEAVDGAVIKPVAQAYVAYAPEPIRTGVSNFFGNIDDLFTGINNVLEGRANQAGDDFGRVLLNTTMGFGGILDLASMVGIPKDKKDFGITFGKWGIPQGPYLFVPLFGPTTVRDGTGVLVRYFIGPVGYIDNIPLRNSLYGLGYLDLRAQALSAESVLDTAALDKYRFLRNAYLKNRRYQVYDGKPPPEEDEDGSAPPAAAPAPPAAVPAPPAAAPAPPAK
jgi:phospholipid-binding lipoprotein MlaA